MPLRVKEAMEAMPGDDVEAADGREMGGTERTDNGKEEMIKITWVFSKAI